MAVASLDPVVSPLNVYTLGPWPYTYSATLRGTWRPHAHFRMPHAQSHMPHTQSPPYPLPFTVTRAERPHVPTNSKSETLLLLCRRGRPDIQMEGED